MDSQAFFARLWREYSAMTPQAERIRRLFEQVDGPVVNDHVAFRTFAEPPFDLAHLEPALLDLGYRRDSHYTFPDKHLSAWSYVTDAPDQPLIFLSELDVNALSPGLQKRIRAWLGEARTLAPEGLPLFYAGRLWSMPSWQEYQALEAESDYAAWLSVWGFCANHFTVQVNRLRHLTRLEDVVALLEQHGYALNSAGGVIKGSPDVLLEQASTLADRMPVTFGDGIVHRIPSCYYEFARRYPDPGGALYRGFVAASANRIFESTDRNTQR